MGNTVRCFAMELLRASAIRQPLAGSSRRNIAEAVSVKAALDLIYKMKADPGSYVELTFYQKSIE
jgi:hypothetical protein